MYPRQSFENSQIGRLIPKMLDQPQTNQPPRLALVVTHVGDVVRVHRHRHRRVEHEHRNAFLRSLLVDGSHRLVVRTADGNGVVTLLNPTLDDVHLLGSTRLAGRRLNHQVDHLRTTQFIYRSLGASDHDVVMGVHRRRRETNLDGACLLGRRRLLTSTLDSYFGAV